MKIPANVWTIGAGALAVYLVYRTVKGGVKEAAQAVNPQNRDNLVYSALNGLGDITLDGVKNDNFSFGARIYDVLHPWESY